jgi:hypothetical protein
MVRAPFFPPTFATPENVSESKVQAATTEFDVLGARRRSTAVSSVAVTASPERRERNKCPLRDSDLGNTPFRRDPELPAHKATCLAFPLERAAMSNRFQK